MAFCELGTVIAEEEAWLQGLVVAAGSDDGSRRTGASMGTGRGNGMTRIAFMYGWHVSTWGWVNGVVVRPCFSVRVVVRLCFSV